MSLRNPLFIFLILIITYLLYTALPIRKAPWSFIAMSSPATPWLDQCTPYPHPHSYSPERSKLALAVLRNAPVEENGFTLALFRGEGDERPVAVTHKGQVLSVPQATLNDLLQLAAQVKALPATGNFRNTWVIQHPRTSQPIDRIFILDGEEVKEKEVSVQGFDRAAKELKNPVGEYTSLPDSLWELTSKALEARDYGDIQDKIVLDRVKRVVEQWF